MKKYDISLFDYQLMQFLYTKHEKKDFISGQHFFNFDKKPTKKQIEFFNKKPKKTTRPRQQKRQIHPKFCILQFCIYYLIYNFEQEQKEVEQPNYLPVLYSPASELKKDQSIKLLAHKQTLLLPAPKIQAVELDQVEIQDSILDDFQQRVIKRTHAKKRTRKQFKKFAGTFEQVGVFASVACLVFLFLNTFVMINNYNSNSAELSKPKETNTARARPKQHSNLPIYLAILGSIAVAKPRKNGTVDYLTQEQIMTVANMLEQRGNGKRHKLIWLVGANTGLRISDILTLTMNDLYQGKLTMQKTQKQVQLVVLEGVLKICGEFAEENSIADNELLFGEKRRRSNQTKVHRQVDVMSNQAIYKVWVDVGNQLGINIGCHTPRKSFGRILYERTKDISIVAKFLGHTDIASTMHYIGLTKNLMQNTRLDIGLIGL